MDATDKADAAPAGPSPDKRVDALIAIFQGCYVRRSELDATQWKLNLELWTAVGAAAWALHGQHLQGWSLAFLLVPAIHAYMFSKFDQAAWCASKRGAAYVDALEKLIGSDVGERLGSAPANYSKWRVVQVGPTVVLALAAITLTWR
jgi:hypothetical protein